MSIKKKGEKNTHHARVSRVSHVPHALYIATMSIKNKGKKNTHQARVHVVCPYVPALPDLLADEHRIGKSGRVIQKDPSGAYIVEVELA